MTGNEKTEWITIKIPEEIRDEARDDPRTYGEIMDSGLVFDVDPKTVERFMDLKAELDAAQDGVPDTTVQAFLESLMDTWRAVGDEYYELEGNDVEALADRVAERVVKKLDDDE
jgi:hypothetical protein